MKERNKVEGIVHMDKNPIKTNPRKTTILNSYNIYFKDTSHIYTLIYLNKY
jgi:hypothetical protein